MALFLTRITGLKSTRRQSLPSGSELTFTHEMFHSLVHRALTFVFIFDAILLLLPLVSTVAFDSIVGITTIGFDVSYGIPILLKLIFAKDSFPKTPLDLGLYSNLLNILSCIWLFGTSILLFLPQTYPVTESSMNWTVLVVTGFAIIAITYWYTYAKFHFRGPGRGRGDIDSQNEVRMLVDNPVHY